ncbi:multifunctional acyl-CoA thioesterase I/protease I/lysophospholipase L1 [Psychrosphaera haliotis]|uniref:arylesterase n=1 Tax=Psychrosphaera haliotis TaxID=555083 RepID=UPI0031D38ABF
MNLYSKRNSLNNTSFLFVLFTLLFTFSIASHAKSTKVLMYGDSVSAGYGMKTEQSWPYLLSQTFVTENAGINLVNASISGETTGGGVARLASVMKRQELNEGDWVILELGGNDGLRGFPISTLKTNLQLMIDQVKSHNVNVALMQVRIPPNYGKRYTTMFEDVYKDLAKTNSIKLLPFFMEKVAMNKNYMMPDGIHPNVSAQVIIRDEMKEVIESLIAD